MIAEPVALPGFGHISTTASVGITVCTGRNRLPAALGTADAAMYQAERNGGGSASPVPPSGTAARASSKAG